MFSAACEIDYILLNILVRNFVQREAPKLL
jgi:hypothetical protein